MDINRREVKAKKLKELDEKKSTFDKYIAKLRKTLEKNDF